MKGIPYSLGQNYLVNKCNLATNDGYKQLIHELKSDQRKERAQLCDNFINYLCRVVQSDSMMKRMIKLLEGDKNEQEMTSKDMETVKVTDPSNKLIGIIEQLRTDKNGNKNQKTKTVRKLLNILKTPNILFLSY